MQIEMIAVDALVPYARNTRTHSDEQVAQIAASIREFGFTNPVLIDGDGGIIAGHGRVLGARKLGMAEVPCIRLGHLSEAQRRAYVIADNKLAMNAGWDDEMLALELRDLQGMDFDLSLTGFEGADIDALLAGLDATPEGATDADAVPDVQAEVVTKPGDVWVMGKHRVMCGDSTNAGSVKVLTVTGSADCILTDPPYCSGGFQEAGKSAGSIGTRQGLQIANDRLSTRGYIALMKSVLQVIDAPILYAFTDWRMWTNLFDVAESNGFGARSMIVWNKGSPGMGRGWRSQHEIILLGAKESIPFSPQKSQGNVITCKRQANELHPTQKPVDLMETIINTTDFAGVFYDPFGGSGTTLMACEKTGKAARLMELSPGYVDVAVRRWQQYTGKTATLESTGEPFPADLEKAA